MYETFFLFLILTISHRLFLWKKSGTVNGPFVCSTCNHAPWTFDGHRISLGLHWWFLRLHLTLKPNQPKYLNILFFSAVFVFSLVQRNYSPQFFFSHRLNIKRPKNIWHSSGDQQRSGMRFCTWSAAKKNPVQSGILSTNAIDIMDCIKMTESLFRKNVTSIIRENHDLLPVFELEIR